MTSLWMKVKPPRQKQGRTSNPKQGAPFGFQVEIGSLNSSSSKKPGTQIGLISVDGRDPAPSLKFKCTKSYEKPGMIFHINPAMEFDTHLT